MRCPNCKSKAIVVNSKDDADGSRVRQYRCEECNSYLHTRETLIFYYRPSEKVLESYKKMGRRKHND